MTLQEIKTAIENGANWNGKVYGKNVGNRRNNVDLSIYLDGKYIALGRHFYEHANEEKERIANFLNGSDSDINNVEEKEDADNNIMDYVKDEAKKTALELASDNAIFG